MPVITQVDFNNPAQVAQWLKLLDTYARDPMGGGKPLSDFAHQHLCERIKLRTDFVSFIAYENNEPVGLINAIEGFSTFNARPLMNIHDVVVVQDARSKGVAQQLLNNLARYARARDCCKLTLEVLSGNLAAKRAYQKFGFKPYELDPEMGVAEFLECGLDP